MKRTSLLITALALVAAACGGPANPGGDGGEGATTSAAPTTTTTVPAPTEAPPPVSRTEVIDEGDPANVELPFELTVVGQAWPTNWARRTIELDELRIGIGAPDPRDLIRPIDDPIYENITSADEWLEDREQGILLDVAGEVIFFPIRILISHEIVNDQRGDVPFSLTYCPLCNSAAAFDRRVDGQVLRFGVSGLLRNSDLVMWDDATVSLWQQITGESIVGDFAGTQLTFLPTALVRWADFKANHPDGDVLSVDSGPFNYGTNAYVGYTSRTAPYGRFFSGDQLDERYEALSRVVGVRVGEATKAYPFEVLAEERAVNDEFNGVPLVVLWGAVDTADPLDSGLIANGQAIGTAVAFDRRIDGRVPAFVPRDTETGALE